MTTRVIGVLAASSLVFAPRLAAQRAGTVEVGALVRYTDFDRSLGLGSTLGVGGGVGLYVRPGLALELDVSHATAYTPVHARLVGAVATGGRVEALLGGGYVRNSYGGALGASDGGFSGTVGARYRLNDRTWLRAGLDADVMFHTNSDPSDPFPFYNGNWSLHVGVTMRLTGG